MIESETKNELFAQIFINIEYFLFLSHNPHVLYFEDINDGLLS